MPHGSKDESGVEVDVDPSPHGAIGWSTTIVRFLGAFLLLMVISACGGTADRSEELRTLLEEGQFTEALARVELYRADGERGPWLDFAEGLGRLEADADKIAVPLLERAVAADSTLAPWAARELAERARADWGQEWENRATRRMAQAWRFDSSIELGELFDPVADYFYRFEKDYAAAYILYRTLAERAREAGKEGGFKEREWLYRWAYCLEEQGFRDAAMSVYEEFQHLHEGDMQIMRYVMWRWMHALIDQAREAQAASNPRLALELLQRAIDPGWHVDLQQQARYLAGEIERERGNLDAARDWYRQIIDEGSNIGGEVVEDAKTRLEELRVQGVY